MRNPLDIEQWLQEKADKFISFAAVTLFVLGMAVICWYVAK